MKKWLWAALVGLPVAVGGLAFASSHRGTANQTKQNEGGYVCPLTGEVLPCPNCCPLNKGE